MVGVVGDAEEVVEGAKAPVLDGAVELEPPRVGFGMPEIPFGPPVRVVMLLSRMRMISPKPRVTMAR